MFWIRGGLYEDPDPEFNYNVDQEPGFANPLEAEFLSIYFLFFSSSLLFSILKTVSKLTLGSNKFEKCRVKVQNILDKSGSRII